MSMGNVALTVMLLLAVGMALQPDWSQHETALSAGFEAKAGTNRGTIRLAGPIEEVFPLFGPVQEKKWAPGWAPQILSPVGVEVALGMVFIVREDPGDVYWVVTRYDAAGHAISYANVLPGSTLNRIEIQCRAVAEQETECTVEYSYVGLSDAGNRYVERQNEKTYAAKMAHWTEAINHWLKTGKTIDLQHH